MADYKNITILAPTPMEAEAVKPIAEAFGAVTVVSGVGMAETAGTVALLREETSLAILAGIAGALPGSGFAPGDSAVAVSESIADLGAVREGGFVPLFQKTYGCPLAGSVTSVRRARMGTVNCVDPALRETPGYEIENMEGAAFFAGCLSLGIPFLQVRAVSNFTSDIRDNWQIDRALESLADALQLIFEELR